MIPVAPSGSMFIPGDVEPVFSPGGEQIAALIPAPRQPGEPVTVGPSRLAAWELVTGKRLFSVAINSNRPSQLHYNLDGASLVMGTKDGPVAAALFYDAITGERQGSTTMPGSPSNYFIDVRNQLFFAIVGSDSVLWDLATGQERLRLPAYGRASQYAISPDGSRLVMAQSPRADGELGELTFLSLKSGRRLLSLQHQGWLRALSFLPDGNRLQAAVAQPSTSIKPIQIWDATPLTNP